jgi:hypothetical protein
MSHERLWPFTAAVTPCLVASVKPARDIHQQDHAVVDMMAQLLRSFSPPTVGRNAKLRRLVQLPSV